jgi:hypothetical protein
MDRLLSLRSWKFRCRKLETRKGSIGASQLASTSGLGSQDRADFREEQSSSKRLSPETEHTALAGCESTEEPALADSRTGVAEYLDFRSDSIVHTETPSAERARYSSSGPKTADLLFTISQDQLNGHYQSPPCTGTCSPDKSRG